LMNNFQLKKCVSDKAFAERLQVHPRRTFPLPTS
jgi:hypothetical protein